MSGRKLQAVVQRIAVAFLVFSLSMFAQTPSKTPTVILLRNVRIFDGRSTAPLFFFSYFFPEFNHFSRALA